MPSRGTESAGTLRARHSPDAVRRRLGRRPRSSYLSDFIYGAIDGAVTTFAVVSGVEGAKLSASIVVILGAANLIADGFSMAAANFLGTRAENQQRLRARREEAHEIETYPAGEREEIRQIFKRKGFDGEVLEKIVHVITADKQRWIDVMIAEEHGLALQHRSSWRAALSTLVAFILIGAIPLAPFVPGFDFLWFGGPAFAASIVMTGLAFFTVGAIKSRFVDQTWLRAGLETLLVGAIAASLAYVIGVALRGLAE